jgi:hypothetical protein
MEQQVFVGIDVSKKRLDAALRPNSSQAGLVYARPAARASRLAPFVPSLSRKIGRNLRVIEERPSRRTSRARRAPFMVSQLKRCTRRRENLRPPAPLWILPRPM